MCYGIMELATLATLRTAQQRKQAVTVEVFRTNVALPLTAMHLQTLLHAHFPGSRISFDLEDYERVLRIEGLDLCPEKIMDLLQAQGYHCSPMD